MPKVDYAAHDGACAEPDIAKGAKVMHGARYNGAVRIAGKCGRALAFMALRHGQQTGEREICGFTFVPFTGGVVGPERVRLVW